MKPTKSNSSSNNFGAFVLPILLQVIGLVVLMIPYVMQVLLGNDSGQGASRNDAVVALLYFGLPGLALSLSGLAILIRRLLSR